MKNVNNPKVVISKGSKEGKILLKKDINNDLIEIPINKITKIIISNRDGYTI